MKEYPKELFETIHISPSFSVKDFKIPAEGKRALCRVIGMIPDQIINNELHEWMEIEAGEILPDVDRDILKLSVVERYGKNWTIPDKNYVYWKGPSVEPTNYKGQVKKYI
jgi:adenine deaminase